MRKVKRKGPNNYGGKQMSTTSDPCLEIVAGGFRVIERVQELIVVWLNHWCMRAEVVTTLLQ